MLRFPYLAEPLRAPPPASLPATATGRWRPLVPITILGARGVSLSFGKALVDPGADDTIFPFDVVSLLGVSVLPSTGHAMRWQGQRFPLRYARVELELVDDQGSALRWPAVVAFTTAAMRYPLLGVAGCLEFFDVKFLGAGHEVEFEPNSSFPGTAQP
jgi:hypothetical protein